MNPDIAQKITTFFNAYPLRQYRKGETIIQAHENPQGIMQLTEGTVRQFDISKDGQKIVLNIFRPPAFFPMSWAINQTPNTHVFEAIDDVSFHLVPPQDTIAFLMDNPDVMLNLLGRVYRGTDGVLKRMALLMSDDARSRLMFELLVNCRRFGVQASETGSWTMEVKESDLAAYTGLTRETVSRLFQKLRTEGLIELERGQVTIPDLDLFEQRMDEN